jgi:hypothetical protein
VNWTKLLADAGIPEPPGREEAIEAVRRKREEQEAAKAAEDAAATQRHQERLAAQGDTKKAIRSKVRVGG